MRAALLLAALLLSGTALADLYRWIDPETGSVRISNHPPPENVKAEVLPYRPIPQPEKPAPAKPVPGRPATERK